MVHIKSCIVSDCQYWPRPWNLDQSRMPVHLLQSNRGDKLTESAAFCFHSHPIGILAKAEKKSGWHGSLTLSLDRGEKKKHQTNRIETQLTRATLQSDSAAFSLETCARDWRGFHGTNFQSMESRGMHALCTTDPCDRPQRCLRRARTLQRAAFGLTRGDCSEP